MPDLPGPVKDAAYVAVGFGVLGFQRAQVRRREVSRLLTGPRHDVEAGFEGARSQLSGLVHDLDERLKPVRQELNVRLDEISGSLPPQAREVVDSARDLAKATEEQVRHLVIR